MDEYVAYEEEKRSSNTSLSFFHTKSTVYHPRPSPSPYFPVRKFSKIENYLADISRTYIPLSLFTTIVGDDAPINMEEDNSSAPVSFRSYMEALMSTVDHPCPIRNVTTNYTTPLSFLYTKGSTFYLPPPLRKFTKNYIPLSSGSKVKVSTNSIIPDDLVFSILSKLPVKSLKRFRCVRKSWSVLFEDSLFMTMYSNHFLSRHAFEDDYHTFIFSCHSDLPVTPEYLCHSEFHLLNNSGVKFNLPPPFQQSGRHRSILGSTSVNGIFCLAQEYPTNLQYVLWNPATEELRVIPRSPAELSPQHPQNNLSLTHAFHGFGYDQVRHDFKVIQYVSFDPDFRYYPRPRQETYFEIYSLKNNSWRTIDMELVFSGWFYCESFDAREVYVHGACHWLVFAGTDPLELTLLSFDLSDEAFLITPIGDIPYTHLAFQACLTVLNGSIALLSHNDEYGNDITLTISILGEVGVNESWIKLYICGPFSIYWPPVGFGKKGYIFFRKKDNKLACVDLSTQEIEEIGITCCAEENYFRIGLYKKSLLSIGGLSN